MMRLGAWVAATLVGMSATAFAADYGVPNAYPSYPALQPEVPVELGTGWYLRGDASFARETTPDLFGSSAMAGISAPVGSQLNSAGKIRNSWSLGLGFGYQFNNWIRADLTYDYRNTMRLSNRSAQFNCPFETRGLYTIAADGTTQVPVATGVINNKCTAAENISLNRSVFLANAYIDLGTFAGVTPYVGAGAGFSYGSTQGSYNWYNVSDGSVYGPTLSPVAGYPLTQIHYDNMGNRIPTTPVNYGVQNRAQVTRANTWAFAWALMAGFSYDLTARAKLDVGYRYLNMGNPSKGPGSKALTSNEVRVGFRYLID